MPWSSSPDPEMPERFIIQRNDSLDPEKLRVYNEALRGLPFAKTGVSYRALMIPTADTQSQSSGCPGREFRQSSQPTTTPETQRLSPVVPNAPMKQRKATKKIDLRPKKLDYTEPENEHQNSIESGISSGPRSVHSAKNLPRAKNSKGKELRSKLNGKKTMSNCDKENINNFENEIQSDQGHSSNLGQIRRAKNHMKLSVLPNRLQLEESESDSGSEDSEQEERRKWLELHQDDGIWIECCSNKCKKWRFTTKFSDPLSVPKKWYCHDNNDPNFASCNVPEEKIPRKVEKQLIENKYCRGSLVWARLDGFPWWPAMVENCPTTLLSYELKESSNVPIKYHVVFFYMKRGDRAWIPDKDLKSFEDNSRSNIVKKTKFRTVDYKDQLDHACRLASDAQKIKNVIERADTFGLVARWCKNNEATSKDLLGRGRKRGSTVRDEDINPTSSKNIRIVSVARESAEIVNSRASKNGRSKNKCKKSVETKSETIDDASIETKYKVGDIVWARPKDYPWWPAIIDTCPIAKLHCRLAIRSNIPIKYHVVYFNKERYETDWRSNRDLKDFASNPRRTVVTRTKFRGTDYRDKLDDACELAQGAELLSPEERVNRFGVVARSLSENSPNFDVEPQMSPVSGRRALDKFMKAFSDLYAPRIIKSQRHPSNDVETEEKNDESGNEKENLSVPDESSIPNNESLTLTLENSQKSIDHFAQLSRPSSHSDQLPDFETGSMSNSAGNFTPDDRPKSIEPFANSPPLCLFRHSDELPDFDKRPTSISHGRSALENCRKSVRSYERSPPSGLSRPSNKYSNFKEQHVAISADQSEQENSKKYSDVSNINLRSDEENGGSSAPPYLSLSPSRLDDNIKYFDSIEVSPPMSFSDPSLHLRYHDKFVEDESIESEDEMMDTSESNDDEFVSSAIFKVLEGGA